jgi:hypothetical protein
MPGPDYGKIAYDAYVASSKGKSLISGLPLPNWAAQAQNIKDAWRAAAEAVIKESKTPVTYAGSPIRYA